MTTNYSKWLNKRIGKKSVFRKKYGYTDRDLYRWCFGHNLPSLLINSQLLSHIALHNKTSLKKITYEANTELLKDYEEKFNNKKSK